MSVNEIPLMYVPPRSRARTQRRLGLVLMTALCLFVSFGSVWGYGEVSYRGCLAKHDTTYATTSGFEHITWKTTKTLAATQCSEVNVVPTKYLM